MLRNEVVSFPPAPAAGGWEMRILLMLLPGADPATAQRELLPAWITAGVDVTAVRQPPPAVMSPLDHPLLRAIDVEVKRRHRGVVTGPFFHPWTATDARFLRPLGIPTYGFSPFLILSPDTQHMHRPNERVPLTTFVDGIDLYRDVVRRALADNSRQRP
jgi:amidohydrolase/aminoacylase